VANVDVSRAARVIDVADLARWLEELLAATPDAVLAFDGDGTLWSGDVGEDTFHAAVHAELLHEEAREPLEREARAYGVPCGRTPSETARSLFDAWEAGVYPERDVCAMMAWCYGGLSVAELTEHTRCTLERAALGERLHRELEGVFELARSAGARTLVISASPQVSVEHGASLWGIPSQDVIAACPKTEGGRVLPELLAPVPYGEDKPRALVERAGGRPLLASFGDNVFDIELLQAARVAIAVRPKSALRRRLAELPGVLVLE